MLENVSVSSCVMGGMRHDRMRTAAMSSVEGCLRIAQAIVADDRFPARTVTIDEAERESGPVRRAVLHPTDTMWDMLEERYSVWSVSKVCLDVAVPKDVAGDDCHISVQLFPNASMCYVSYPVRLPEEYVHALEVLVC